jgi:hypothetical protein
MNRIKTVNEFFKVLSEGNVVALFDANDDCIAYYKLIDNNLSFSGFPDRDYMLSAAVSMDFDKSVYVKYVKPEWYDNIPKPGKLSLIEIEENMISLDKKYVTASGNEVVLLEIYDNQVFGRAKTPSGNWYSDQWDINGINSNSSLKEFNLIEVPEFKIVTLKQNFTKPVLYYGTLFTVTDSVNYMATDKDGTVFGYSTKPILEGGGNMWVNTDFIDGVEISVVEFEGDWRQSLQQV